MAACMYEQNQGILSKTLTISRKDILGVPGKEKLNRMKLEVCENLAPSPPIFT